MKTLKEQIMGKCRRFNGIQNKKCDDGILYKNVESPRPPGKGYGLPRLLDADAAGRCDMCSVPTEAEADAEIAEHKKRFDSTMNARKAIVEAVGPWKKGIGFNGAIDCPVCNGNKTLHYSRDGLNGHIHARCDTKDCVS